MAVFKKFKPKPFKAYGKTGFVITPSRKIAESKHYDITEDFTIRGMVYPIHRKRFGSNALPELFEVGQAGSEKEARKIVIEKEKQFKK